VSGEPPSEVRHRAAAGWVFPPAGRAPIEGVRRVNLRELAARPERFEHHLVVVARVGDAQLEVATASEPLYFAHVNVSDEYAIALPTGDEIVDRFPLRTFLTDAATGEDVARYNHRVGDLVLHPLGLMHWPGRLRPPYEPLAIPRGMRRCGLSLVFCACVPTPAGDRPLAVSEGRAADAKSYVSISPPLALLDALREKDRVLARVGRATLDLRVRPRAVAAPRGAYVVVLEAAGAGPHHACDLVHVPPGGVVDAAGIERALVFASDSVEASPPPASWERLPEPPFAPFEAGERAPLPFARADLTATDAGAAHVGIAAGGASAVVPRHWLARTLFRIGLHRPALGYVETYGGFFYDDRRAADAGVAIGVRGGEPLVLAHDAALALVEALYRAVAPDGYTERCPD